MVRSRADQLPLWRGGEIRILFTLGKWGYAAFARYTMALLEVGLEVWVRCLIGGHNAIIVYRFVTLGSTRSARYTIDMKPEIPSQTIQNASENFAKNRGVNLNDEMIRTRIRTEALPVIAELSELIQQVAEFVREADTPATQFAQLERQLREKFAQYDCAWQYEQDEEYPAFTSLKNPASLQWDAAANRVTLWLHPKFEHAADREVQEELLKEYIHELGALMLMRQLQQNLGLRLDSRERLDVLKRLLRFSNEDPRNALTHIVDAVVIELARRQP